MNASFNDPRQNVFQRPILAFPNFDKLLLVETNASSFSLKKFPYNNKIKHNGPPLCLPALLWQRDA